MKICDHDMNPNLHMLLRIFVAIPTTSYKYERLGSSVLRCLHTYWRASVRQTCLSALALLHINYDANVDTDNVIDIFAKKKERDLEFVKI